MVTGVKGVTQNEHCLGRIVKFCWESDNIAENRETYS